MKEEKLYKIYYGENKEDYILGYLKEDEIIDGYLSEAKAFEIFYSDMVMCNNYFKNCNYDEINIIISNYDEEEDYYIDEYQTFIVNIEYGEEITTKATKLMGNTLYYDNEKELYLTGITDLGTSRRIVPTRLKVGEALFDEE